MSPHQIQFVARTRHIVVQNVPQRHFEWSYETFSELGSLDQPRDIQGIIYTLIFIISLFTHL
jgi:hypothetical protein